MITSKLIPPSALRLALQDIEGSSRNTVVDLSRLLAAFYLGFPLFEPQRGTAYPSLFLWSQLNEKEIPADSTIMSRTELGQDLPPEYGPRLPAILLTYYGLILEAILYCDHFSDFRSSIMLRIFADHLHELKLCRVFYEELRTIQLMKQVELLVNEKADLKKSTTSYYRFVQSILDLELFNDEEELQKMQMFIISQLEILFAQLPLRVQDVSILPRPPIYCPQEYDGVSAESKSYVTMHHLLELLCISMHETNRINIEINKLHHVICDESTHLSHSFFVQAFVIVLRTIYRDCFSLAVFHKQEDLSEIAAKYNALILATDNNEEVHQLKSWMALSTDEDRQHVDRFFTFISERFPEKNDLPPLTPLTRPVWKEAMLRERPRIPPRPADWLSTITTSSTKLSKHDAFCLPFLALND